MRPKQVTQSNSIRPRRIGRKALQADRLSRILTKHNSSKFDVANKFIRVHRVKLTAVSLAVIIFGIVGSFGIQAYNAQQVAAQKAEAAKAQDIARQKSISADECRQKKAEEKSELIGKVTYDELYDGNECDK